MEPAGKLTKAFRNWYGCPNYIPKNCVKDIGFTQKGQIDHIGVVQTPISIKFSIRESNLTQIPLCLL